MNAIKELNSYIPFFPLFIAVISICFPLFGINSLYAQGEYTLTFDWSPPKIGNPVYYYKIYQSVDSSSYDSMGTTSDTTFSFVGLLGHTYRVKVSAVDSIGIEGPLSEASKDTTLSSVSNTGNESSPKNFFLSQNFPNPFNSTTTIDYQLSTISGQRSTVSLIIYNSLGEEVKKLVDGKKKPGYYEVIWDGRNNWGGETSSGVYYYRLQYGSFVRTRKMIFLK